jgi:hypothetical protein
LEQCIQIDKVILGRATQLENKVLLFCDSIKTSLPKAWDFLAKETRVIIYGFLLRRISSGPDSIQLRQRRKFSLLHQQLESMFSHSLTAMNPGVSFSL